MVWCPMILYLMGNSPVLILAEKQVAKPYSLSKLEGVPTPYRELLAKLK